MRTRTLIPVFACALALSACGGGKDTAADTAGEATPATTDTPVTDGDDAGTVPEPAAPAAAGFDIEKLPVSDATLGEFPYLRLPDGYQHYTRDDASDFDRVPFWTGDGVEWVEGRSFGSLITAVDGKSFSLLELMRNLQAAITDAGGVEVAKGKIPGAILDAIDAEDERIGVRYNAGRGDVRNRPVETWVIRRADRVIWIQLNGYEHGGSLLLVETKPVEITAGLLEADKLRQELDADGRVAIQVNFAVDKAEVLAESRPQLDQVVALLNDDPALRLSVEGHTDDSGSADHNRKLSEARAQSVVSELVAGGIDATRLSAAGFGPDRPVADNGTEEGKARNRRVELVKA